MVPLLTDPTRLASMGRAAAAFGRRDADERLVDLVVKAVEAGADDAARALRRHRRRRHVRHRAHHAGARGYVVSGSDAKDGREVAALRALGATVHVGHDAAYVAGAETVVVSTAIRARQRRAASRQRRVACECSAGPRRSPR